MRADAFFAVPVKLWALLCFFAGVTIGGNVLLTCILTGGALLYLVLQRNFRLAASYGCFYLLLALLLYGIRFHGLRMPVFSEFYVLMFWNRRTLSVRFRLQHLSAGFSYSGWYAQGLPRSP